MLIIIKRNEYVLHIINHFLVGHFLQNNSKVNNTLMKKKCCFVWPLRECFTEGTLIELGKCDFDITRPRDLRLESVKQTKITVLRRIQRRICIIGEDFSPSLGIHEHGEIVSCISIAYVTSVFASNSISVNISGQIYT